jgi:hypothetical protein
MGGILRDHPVLHAAHGSSHEAMLYSVSSQCFACVRACVRPRRDALAAASCAALTRPAPALSGISAACVTLHTACCIPIRGPERSIAYVSRPLRWNQPPMRLALQALERPKLEPFVPAKTAKQPFPITTYCTLSVRHSPGPVAIPRWPPTRARWPHGPLPACPCYFTAHTFSAACACTVCRYRHRRKHPRYPTL